MSYISIQNHTLVMNSVDLNGNKKSTSITNANPRVDESWAYEFCQKLNDLTTHTFKGADRVVKSDLIDKDEDPRAEQNEHLDQTVSLAEIVNKSKSNPYYYRISIPGIKVKGALTIKSNSGDNIKSPEYKVYKTSDEWFVCLAIYDDISDEDTAKYKACTLTVTDSGNFRYKPASFEITFTD